MSARTSTTTSAATALIAILLVACSGSQTPPASAPGGSAAVPSASPSIVPSTTNSPSVSGSPAPSLAVPKPSSAPESPDPATAAWSKPEVVDGLRGCSSVVAIFDAAGTAHLAASCAVGPLSEVQYAVSSGVGRWTATSFPAPTRRLEMDPQLAIEGSTLYLAYTRLAPTDGGCGDDGMQDVGVYYRQRSLPNGAWSEPHQIGGERDELQSFRVSGGVVYATLYNDSVGATVFTSQTDHSDQRIIIPGAVGSTSMRIGDDQKPRIAFEADGIAYATVDADALTSTTISGTSRGWDPGARAGARQRCRHPVVQELSRPWLRG